MVEANEQCSQSDINSFMNQTQSFMDSTDWVERYAWFGAMENMQGVNQASNLLPVTPMRALCILIIVMVL